MINSENPFFREIALFALWEREDGNVVNMLTKCLTTGIKS